MIDQNQLCHGKKNISTDQFNRNSKVNVVDRLKPAFMVSSSLANVLKEKKIFKVIPQIELHTTQNLDKKFDFSDQLVPS